MSPAPTGAHPSEEEVDALLDPSGGSTEVAAHVGTCERCGRLHEGLLEVRALLHDEARRPPDPPPDLAARIADALAAASPAATSGSSAGGSSTRSSDTRTADVVPLASRRRSGSSRWFAAAAGVAVVVGAGAVATQVAGGGTSQTTGFSGASLESGGSDEAAEAPAAAPPGAGAAVLDTGTDYSQDGLGDQVSGLLTASRVPAPAQLPLMEDAQPDPGAPADPEAPEGSADSDSSVASPQAGPLGDRSLADPAALRDCLTGLEADTATPVAVDLATYQGQPAAVLVLDDPADADGLLQVWVVPRDCGLDDPDVLGFARHASE